MKRVSRRLWLGFSLPLARLHAELWIFLDVGVLAVNGDHQSVQVRGRLHVARSPLLVLSLGVKVPILQAADCVLEIPWKEAQGLATHCAVAGAQMLDV